MTVASRIHCRAIFLDAGGVIVLPEPELVSSWLARAGVEIDPHAVARAHYDAVRLLERDPVPRDTPDPYMHALCQALRVPRARLSDAVAALARLADRRASGEIMWSRPAPDAQRTIDALGRAGIAVFVVTNSDGHAAENLRDAAICSTTAGAGAVITDVIDSTVVGSAKPDPRIFEVALGRAGVPAESVVHVGDTLSADIAGAHAAGIVPIHLDPSRRCRLRDHRHIRSLRGIWHHIAPAP